jgi:subtilase family serine protease
MNRNYLMVLTALSLTACGGGQSQVNQPSSGVTLAAADFNAQPTFHRLPMQVELPADDVDGSGMSAYTTPRQEIVPNNLAALPTARQTDDDVAAFVSGTAIRPNATAGFPATVYTPAQIRAAYDAPAIPTGTLSLSQAQTLGAGQTIYIIDAYDNPNAIMDLMTFNTKFGLPKCSTATIPASAPLPLTSAPLTGCTVSVVYSSTTGMSASKPPYNSGWASEIALDLEWAHVQAPYARIVVIETADASLNGLLAGINLANKMGPGIVSMSFGGAEGSYVASTNSSFMTTGMTYVASAGDAGYAANWPAVSPYVVSVGGTTLAYTGTGARRETTWAGSGGGISQVVPQQSWQTKVKIVGQGKTPMRAANDVSLNADPSTGVYVAFTPLNGTTGYWIFGGTSAGAPQWAGMLACVNAQRAAVGKAMVGDVHAALYTKIAGVPGTYATAFGDISTGADGTLATAGAQVGYDIPTGLGTPNFFNLSQLLTSF